MANRTDGPDELINAYASINKTSILCQFIEAYAENLLSSSIFLSNLSSDAILLLKNVINKKIAYRSANGSLLIPQDRINNLQAKLNSDDPLFSSTNSSSYSSRETVINPILTPFGKIVPYAMNQEISRDSIELLTEQYVKRYAVQLVDSASNIYNCHAYAWASSRQVWINNPVNLYTTNDLYFQSDSNVAVIYYLGDHSAVQRKADDSGVYVSKWGNGPLVRHAASTVPALYQPNNRVNYSLPYIQGVDTGYSGENTYIYTMYHI